MYAWISRVLTQVNIDKIAVRIDPRGTTLKVGKYTVNFWIIRVLVQIHKDKMVGRQYIGCQVSEYTVYIRISGSPLDQERTDGRQVR